jgi:hypothetical protein
MAIPSIVKAGLVAVALAAVAAIAFPALGYIGGTAATDVYLLPGVMMASALPSTFISWLEGDPEVSHGTFSVLILSFASWWLLLLAASALIGARLGSA